MTVTNPYYEFDPTFIPFTKARAGDNNLQFQALQNAFDLLPSDSDALTTDTATFGPESGTGNVYVVTLADTRTSNQDGDGVRFFATHTNTGPSTLNIDAIGAIALVNWTGSVLGGGEIVSGQIYEIRYDAANVQYVISASTDAAIQVGYAEEWAIKAEDVPVSTAAGGNGTTDFSSFHWAQKSLASAITGRVNTDIVTATPPTTEAVTGAFEIYDAVAEDNDLLSRLGFQASNTLVLRNLMHGGDFQLSVETAAGVEVPYKFSDTRMAIPNAVGVTFDDSGAVERESLIMETGAGGDPLWSAEVEASADWEGADGATSYTELSLNLAAATFHGGAELDTAQFNSGTSSLLCTRSTSDFASFPDIAAYDFGTQEWTLEGFVRFATLPAVGLTPDPGCCIASIWDDGNVEQIRYEIIRDGFGTRVKISGNGGWEEQGTISGGVALNTWFHWAVTRDSGGDIRAYFNGNHETGDFGAAPADMGGSAAPLRIGQSDGIGRTDFMDGWIDDVRLTIGTARYTGTGSITPESTPFPSSDPPDAFKVGSAAIQTIIRGSGGDAAQTIAAASGGLEVNNTLTGAGLERVLTIGDLGSGGRVTTDINTATPPTTEAVSGEFQIFDADETDQLMRLGYVASNELNLHNFMHNGELRLSGEDAAGTVKTFFLADPNSIVDITANTSLRLFIDAGNNAVVCTGGAGVDLYDNNIERFSVTTSGSVIVRSDGNTDAETRNVIFAHQDGTVRGSICHLANDIFAIRNEIHNGEINIVQEDPSGVDVVVFSSDASGGHTEIVGANVVRLGFANGEQAFRAQVNSFAQIHHNNIQVFRTTTTALGGVFVDNLLTGSGSERVLTESDLPGLQVAVKKADTSRASTITLTDDPDLAITVDGTAYYAVTIHGHVTCAAAGIDMKYALDGATGRLIQALMTYAPETSTGGGVAIFGESTDQGNGGTIDLDGVFEYSFTYTGYAYFSTGGAGARTIEFTWSQNISNATAVVLKEGSWMTVQKLADF